MIIATGGTLPNTFGSQSSQCVTHAWVCIAKNTINGGALHFVWGSHVSNFVQIRKRVEMDRLQAYKDYNRCACLTTAINTAFTVVDEPSPCRDFLIEPWLCAIQTMEWFKAQPIAKRRAFTAAYTAVVESDKDTVADNPRLCGLNASLLCEANFAKRLENA